MVFANPASKFENSRPSHSKRSEPMIDDERNDSEKQAEAVTDLSRRDFIAMSVAAVVVAAPGPASAAAMQVSETDVTIKTHDGTCDAAFIHPTTGSHPGVVIWPDAFGLRPVMRDIGKRIAAEGYSVLVPNPFYRVAKAPVIDEDKVRSFNFQTDMPKIQLLMASINALGAAEKDAVAFVAFLDSFFFNNTANNEVSPLSLRVALPIGRVWARCLMFARGNALP